MAASSPSKTTRRSVRSTVNILRPLRLCSLLFRSYNAVNAFPDLLGFFDLVTQFIIASFNQFPLGGQLDDFGFPFRHGRGFFRVETPLRNIAPILFGFVVHCYFVAVGFVVLIGGGKCFLCFTPCAEFLSGTVSVETDIIHKSSTNGTKSGNVTGYLSDGTKADFRLSSTGVNNEFMGNVRSNGIPCVTLSSRSGNVKIKKI